MASTYIEDIEVTPKSGNGITSPSTQNGNHVTNIAIDNGNVSPDADSVSKHEESGVNSARVVTTAGEKNNITSSAYPVITTEDVVDSSCSWCSGNCSPECAQWFNTSHWLLVFLCIAAIIQGMVVNGFVSISISNIEKRFGLTSTHTGIIASMYDVAVAAVLVPVCYFGAHQNKAKWLGYGTIIMGIGSFVYALPHVLAPVYQYEAVMTNTTNNVLCDDAEVAEDCSSPSLSHYFYVFLLGQVLHGVGASPLYSLGITYIHDNVSHKMSGLFIGIYYACSAIGPAIGYVAGGLHLATYGEIGRVDIETIDINPEDPRWYGAWWIGPLYSCVLAIIIAVPIMGYPKLIPGAAERKAKDIVESYDNYSEEITQPGFGRNLSDLPKSCKVLFTNPTYLCVTLADSSDGFLLGGFVAFAPKFIEFQYSVSAGFASIISGGLVITSAAIGIVTGGWIIKKFNLAIRGIIKVAIVGVILSLLAGFGFLASCPNQPYAGITSTYTGESRPLIRVYDVNSDCNSHCTCGTEYTPVCDSYTNIMYISPCHAGCTQFSPNADNGGNEHAKGYSSCSCAITSHHYRNGNESITSSTQSPVSSHVSTLVPPPLSALDSVLIEGKCQFDCGLMPVFLVFLVGIAVCTMLASIPTQEVVLRCVPKSIQSVGVGFQWLLVRIFGTIPGPIIFGYIIDSTCLFAKETCSESQNCLVYDNASMSKRFMILHMSLKCLSVLGLVLAYKLYKPPAASSEDNVLEYGKHRAQDREQQGQENPAFTMNDINVS